MKYQNKSFIAVAGKVAAIHEEIDKLKELYVGSYGNKTIKLAGKGFFYLKKMSGIFIHESCSKTSC
jgi:hypothetical protein